MSEPARSTRRLPKPELSAHQKQIRFFTGLAMILGFLLFGAIFWFFNQASFATSALR